MANDHRHEWNRFLIRCRDFQSAARIAAANGWWLHCWDWEPDSNDDPHVVDTWQGR